MEDNTKAQSNNFVSPGQKAPPGQPQAAPSPQNADEAPTQAEASTDFLSQAEPPPLATTPPAQPTRGQEPGSASPRPLVIELFAGSAGISSAARDMGFECLAVDYIRNQSISQVPLLNMDLTSVAMQQIVKDKLQPGLIAAVWLAPPCGTASRARDKRVPLRLQQQGVPDPKPLRSEQHPEGLPGLGQTDLVRVQAAIKLYSFSADVFEICLRM